jgi:NTP pyrophosphatase (non-canonical NTP hydrolase)
MTSEQESARLRGVLLRGLLAAVPTIELEYVEEGGEDALSGPYVEMAGIVGYRDGPTPADRTIDIMWKDQDVAEQDIAYFRLFAAAPRALAKLLDEAERLLAERNEAQRLIGEMHVEFARMMRERDAVRQRTHAVEIAARDALLARDALYQTVSRIGTSYDWNADPSSITLLQGDAYTALDRLEALLAEATPPARAAIFQAIHQEREAQNTQFPQSNIPHWSDPDGTKLSVLVEEVGEVARALLESDAPKLRAELIQVAAVAVAWAEAINAKESAI